MRYVVSRGNDMAKGTRFVQIRDVDMFPVLNEIGEAIVSKGGTFARESQPGREVLYTFTPPTKTKDIHFTVYTSIVEKGGSGDARGCGEDAVRIIFHTRFGGTFRKFGGFTVYRTAPKASEEDRVYLFMERFKDKVRDAYRIIMTTPRCPECYAPMVLRNGRAGNFWGCCTFPRCRGSMAA
jgi:hypothetical protein